MFKKSFAPVAVFVFTGVFTAAFGQTPTAAVKPSVVSGDVSAISENKIVVNAKGGAVDVMLGDKTEFKRVAADKPSLAAATPAALSDIAVGDRLMVTGIMAADGKSIPARAVYLMAKSDIAQQNAKQSGEWRTRGITGKVVSVNPQTSQITVEMRGAAGSPNITVTPKDKAKFLRYAPDSNRFSEAKESSIAEIKAGDMLRALGEKSTDGLSFSAEQILTGAFQTIAGTVKSVDAGKNEIVISDFQTKKDVTVMIADSTVLKRFPAEMAERMAGMQMGGAAVARPVNPQAQPTTGGQGQTPGAPRSGLGGGRSGGGIDDMLDRFPDIKAADLKIGDMIALSSTKNGTMERVKAFKLVAGVEPFLKAAMAQAASGGGRGQTVQFNIPGLDGIGTP